MRILPPASAADAASAAKGWKQAVIDGIPLGTGTGTSGSFGACEGIA